jgi:calcineurin-like phosphoesterase family protein
LSKVLKPPFWIISDSHYFHKNIVKYQHRPENHEVLMTTRWQKVVPWDATILHLGDLYFGGDNGYAKFYSQITPQLTGEKYLILGNHDKKNKDYEFLGFTVIEPFTINYRGYEVSFDHYPAVLPKDEKRVHIHGHIHGNLYGDKEKKRYGNINVSVEAIDYRPHRVTRLLNKEITRRNQKPRYKNRRRRKVKR